MLFDYEMLLGILTTMFNNKCWSMHLVVKAKAGSRRIELSPSPNKGDSVAASSARHEKQQDRAFSRPRLQQLAANAKGESESIIMLGDGQAMGV